MKRLGGPVCAQLIGPPARQTISLPSPSALRSARRQAGDTYAE